MTGLQAAHVGRLMRATCPTPAKPVIIPLSADLAEGRAGGKQRAESCPICLICENSRRWIALFPHTRGLLSVFVLSQIKAGQAIAGV